MIILILMFLNEHIKDLIGFVFDEKCLTFNNFGSFLSVLTVKGFVEGSFLISRNYVKFFSNVTM